MDHDARALHLAEHGRNAGRGNLLGVQPWLTQHDYATAEALCARLEGYLRAASDRGWLSERTIVVLPEYLGTWLAAAGAGPGVLKASNLSAAMRALALRQPLRFLRALRHTTERDRLAASLFRMRGAEMAADYSAVSASLARTYRVTLVAGTILLPAPGVAQGQVQAGRGPVQNVAAVFAPDGQAHPALACKLFPTDEEKPMVTGAPLAALPVFDTPAGRLGVLVCADSWHPAAYAHLRTLGVDHVAVPSAILAAGLWRRPWGGYNGATAPPDVDAADVGTLTEGQAWHKYALAGRIGAAGARTGLNVFLRGQYWDTASDGYSLGVADGRLAVEAAMDGPALISVWLE